MIETLMLSKGRVPIETVEWPRAISMCYVLNTAVPVEEYEDKPIRTSNKLFLIPSVIQLTVSDYHPKRFVKNLPFNRKNVYMRDHGKCMYCGKKVGLASFTFDHVTPRYLNGKTEWENIVVSCMRCNSKKGHQSLKRSGMRLIQRPYAPRLNRSAPESIVNKIGAKIPHETWEDYIYWNIELLP